MFARRRSPGARHSAGTGIAVPVVCLLLAAACGLTFPGIARSGESEVNPDLRLRALLIGVSRYPSLSRQRQLRGPVHDVRLMRDLLRQHFSVPDSRIRVLSEESDTRPTREAIALAFRELIENVQAGETVLILLSGHGSRQPAVDAAESDRLDEIFLPRDIGRWNGRTGTVQNAIVDNQIRDWLQQIRARGAFVFFVADTCHAGTLARGQGVRARRVAPDALSIPATSDARDEESTDAERRPPQVGPSQPRFGEGLLALYASHSHELTYEQPLPGRDGQDHGRLTWTLCRVLAETGGAVSYRELARLVHWHYQAQRWALSTPHVEGSEADLNRFVLQAGSARSSLVITPQRKQSGEFQINGGTLRGLAPGAVLAVFPRGPRQQSATPVGYVRVRDAGPVSSTAVPAAGGERRALSSLDRPARCELVHDGSVLNPQRVAVDVSLTTPRQLATTRRQQLEHAITSDADDRSKLFELAQTGTTAEWMLKTDRTGNAVFLSPATGDQTDLRFGPYQIDSTIRAQLSATLTRAVRASRLRHLATHSGIRHAETTLRVNVERRRDAGFRAMIGSEVRPGDELRLTLRNTGRRPVDTTVLYVQSNYDIVPFFPLESELLAFGNRIDAGGEVLIDQIHINDETTGWEDLIVIAVDAAGPIPQDFSFLAQPGLTPARTQAQKHASRASGVKDVFESPLGQRCRRELFGDMAATRGVSEERDNYVIRRISWSVSAP